MFIKQAIIVMKGIFKGNTYLKKGKLVHKSTLKNIQYNLVYEPIGIG